MEQMGKAVQNQLDAQDKMKKHYDHWEKRTE